MQQHSRGGGLFVHAEIRRGMTHQHEEDLLLIRKDFLQVSAKSFMTYGGRATRYPRKLTCLVLEGEEKT